MENTRYPKFGCAIKRRFFTADRVEGEKKSW